MTQRHHHSHFRPSDILRPLFAHLFAVLAVFVIAIVLGLISARGKVGESRPDQLATPTASESSANSVLFSVLATNDVVCQNNVPLTTTGFLAVPPDGGVFHLVSSTGLDVPFLPGSYPLANGTYSWYAIPKDGLSAIGPTAGTILLAGDCGGHASSTLTTDPSSSVGSFTPDAVVGTTSSSTTISTATSSILATSSFSVVTEEIVSPRTILKLFQDNTPLSEGGSGKGVIELRVSDSDVKHVEFMASQKDGVERKLLGRGTMDELLSDENYTTWTYFWNTASASGDYKIVAVVTHASGRVTETLPVAFSVFTPPVVVVPSVQKIESSSTDQFIGVTPDHCNDRDECKNFCESTQERKNACLRYVTARIDGAKGETYLSGRVAARVSIDSDADGISDYDEVNLYGTNPHSADTDKDGFPDGAELLGATNPRGGTTTSEALLSLNGEVFASADSLEHIVPLLPSLEVLDVGIPEASASSSAPEIVLRGKGLPNSYITLFIFSRPFTRVVKADEKGNFAYTLPRELTDGTHHIYATISALNGTPLFRSEDYVFIKRGSHVGRPPVLPVSASEDVHTPVPLFDPSSSIALILLFVGCGLLALAFWWRQRIPPLQSLPRRHTKPLSHVIYLK